jgi:CheY-like chemotaxis protein
MGCWDCSSNWSGPCGSSVSLPLRFPLPRSEAELAAWKVEVGQEYRKPKRTILCIDDDHAVLAFVRRLLERSGYTVLTTASPRQGISLALASPPDAVVLDYQMPEMNGHEVAATIKRFRPETLIVMFSASQIPEETFKLADAVVPKTNTIGHLLTTVTELCNRSLQS